MQASLQRPCTRHGQLASAGWAAVHVQADRHINSSSSALKARAGAHLVGAHVEDGAQLVLIVHLRMGSIQNVWGWQWGGAAR